MLTFDHSGVAQLCGHVEKACCAAGVGVVQLSPPDPDDVREGGGSIKGDVEVRADDAAQNGVDFVALIGLILDAGLARYGLALPGEERRRKSA